ncbi:ABC transporter ATP-binding protein [Cohnella nanjingensis]|uniref:ABC transporter ATP-binding protein n=1 Tax=Cohnella nanjingensis TaxID=1387779 RepID=A0A7X0VGZ6_9BACL|nr:ABC transporter ATP-binding protein [Cohnella nanjingensis]MBB6673600.1 ABC transporter ATP-binding protein [Cohnella nanjingensis]
MSEPLLCVSQLSKSIGRSTLLHPCSLEAARGEIVALCGGNGAGKSTLIRMIAGISQPTQGRVQIGGLSWAQHRAAYADSIGYMPDEFQFGSALTALETLRFYAALRRVPDDRVLELLDTVGLSEVRGRRVSTYSKGMRQRLLFAQAMLARPPLLLLDEPTNGLDPYWMEAFGRLIRQAAGEGQTVVFSTHQLNIAESYADRALFMASGHVRYAGDVGALKAQYRHDGGLYGAFHALVAAQAEA